MNNTTKVSHFFGKPSQRLLETYCNNITTTTSTKEKLIRESIKFFHLNSFSLLCGRNKYRFNGQTTIKFSIINTTFIADAIWHVEGKIKNTHRVILEVNTSSNRCDIIKKL